MGWGGTGRGGMGGCEGRDPKERDGERRGGVGYGEIRGESGAADEERRRRYTFYFYGNHSRSRSD